MSTWAEIRNNILVALDRPTTESSSSDIYQRVVSEMKNVRDKLYTHRPPVSLIGTAGPVHYSASYPYIPIGGDETIIDPTSTTDATLLVQDSFENSISSYWDDALTSFSNQFAVNQSYSMKQTISVDQSETAYVEKQDLLVDEIYVSWYEYFRQGFQFPSQKQELIELHNIDETLSVKVCVVASNADIEIQTVTPTALGDFSASSTITTGEWAKFSLYVKLNSIGSSDGVITLSIDDTEVFSKADASFRTSESYKFSNLHIGGVWDNGGLDPTSTNYRYFDLVRVFDTDPGDSISFITLNGFEAPTDSRPMALTIDDYVWQFVPWGEWVASKNAHQGDARPTPCWTISPDSQIYLTDTPSSDDTWAAYYSYFAHSDDIIDTESPKIDARYHDLIELEVISKFPNLFSSDVQFQQYRAYLALKEERKRDFLQDAGPITRRKVWRVKGLPGSTRHGNSTWIW